MKNVNVDKGGFRYKWFVRGVDEAACVNDILENERTDLTDYGTVDFAERYGCVAEVERVRLMSHNQYQAFLQSNANRMCVDEGYTIEDYRRDAASVEVLPFRLDRFRLTPEVQAVINQKFDSVSYTKDRNACFRCRVGSSVAVGLIAAELGCEVVCNQGDCGFYKSDRNRFVLEFSGGDVSLIACASQMAYAAQLAELRQAFDLDEYGICLEVYFDNVHMDNVFVPRESIGIAISSMLQRGYDGYNPAVKACWEDLLSRRKVPSLSFRAVEAPTMVRDIDFGFSKGNVDDVDIDAVLASAVNRSTSSTVHGKCLNQEHLLG